MRVASSSDFSPGANRGPLIVTEIVVFGAGRDDQRVIADGLTIVQHHGATWSIDIHDLGQSYVSICLSAQNSSQGKRYIGGREFTCSHLVEQRLEQVEITPIDQRHLDFGVSRVPSRHISRRIRPRLLLLDGPYPILSESHEPT